MRLRKIWLLCNLVCIIPGAFAQQFIHPGVLHSEKSLERIKRLVDQKAQPAYGSYEILAKLPEARADYQMKGPFEIISRDGKYGYTKGPSAVSYTHLDVYKRQGYDVVYFILFFFFFLMIFIIAFRQINRYIHCKSTADVNLAAHCYISVM